MGMKIFRNILGLKKFFQPASVPKGTLHWFENHFETKSLQNINHSHSRFKVNINSFRRRLLAAILSENKWALDDPIPSTLTINLLNSKVDKTPLGGAACNHHVLQPITLPHKDGTFITYCPKHLAIGVMTPSKYGRDNELGHAFSIIRKKDSWYEVNDSCIYPIPKAWNEDLEAYCSQYADSIIYEKETSLSDNSALPPPEEMNLNENQLENDVQKLTLDCDIIGFIKTMSINKILLRDGVDILTSFDPLEQHYACPDGSLKAWKLYDNLTDSLKQLTGNQNKAETYEKSITAAQLMVDYWDARCKERAASIETLPIEIRSFWHSCLEVEQKQKNRYSALFLSLQAEAKVE